MQLGAEDIERIGAPEPPEAGVAAQRECTEQVAARYAFIEMPASSRQANAALRLVGPILGSPWIVADYLEHRRRNERFEADVRACLAERGYRVIPR